MTTGVAKKKEKLATSKRFENRTVLNIFLGFIVIIVLVQIISNATQWPRFISPNNILNLFAQNAPAGILAIGMTLVMVGGGIDLSVGLLASLVSIVTALGIAEWNLGVPLALIVGIGSAVLLETILGYIISRTNVEPFIITLGGMIAFRGIALLLCHSREVAMQGRPLEFLKVNLVDGVKDPATDLNLSLPLYVLIFLAIVIIFWILSKYTRFGRRVFAVGSNPNAAFLAGVNVKNVKLLTYTLNGILVGIAAIILLARTNSGIITLGENQEIDAIAMAVIGGTAMSGGKGNMWGTFIGVLLLGSIGNALSLIGLPSEVQFIAKGVIIIFAVAAGALSTNVMGFINKMKNRSAAAEK